ncbi:MAG: hypothetical protein ACXAD7_05155 [Candidatus Kariarchaeaceae archaeon]|jgi:Fe2+ or Zn2+ uptake regulation protein
MVAQENNQIKHHCSHNEEKLKCCHSSEAILLILSRTPWRLSIKELSEITRFHRNTIRPTLKKLLDDKNVKIKSTGDSKSSLYYYGGVVDFYRRQSKAISDLDLPENQIKDIAKNIGFNIVKNTLEEALVDGPEFRHNSLFEALLHIKMAYPFSDITVDESGRARASTVFTVADQITNPADFNLRIHSCLCGGNQDDHVSCEMVMGALEGAIEGACGVQATVKLHGSGDDEKHGPFCEYQIISEITIPKNIDEEQKKTVKLSQ